jgi:carbonic anhydrase
MFFILLSTSVSHAASSCFSALPGPLNIATPIQEETNQLLLQYTGATEWQLRHDSSHLDLVAAGSVGGMQYAGTSFAPQFAEIHAPAEHTLGAKRHVYPAEMQLFHASPQGKVLALSLLFKRGAPSPLFDAVLSAVEKGQTSVAVQLPSLLQAGEGYFAYATPRCANAARALNAADQWVLLSKMATVSDDQVARLAKALPGLAASTRPSAAANGVQIFSAQPGPKAPVPAAAPPVPALPAALVQGGASSQGSLDAVLAAYPPEQREQLVNQYKQWYDNYEKYLTQVQGNQAYTQQALAYEQYQNEQKRAADAQKEASIITGGLPMPMSFLDTTPVAGAKAPLSALQVQEADLARREAAVAAREAAVSKREEEVASIAASLAAMQPPPSQPARRALRGGVSSKTAPAQGESFAQLRTETRTQTQTGALARGMGSDLHVVAAANLPADSGDHEDASTVASATGTADDEDGGEKVKVEDAPSTAAEDAVGENADNDDLENILLQKAARTHRVPVARVPPAGKARTH